MNRLVDDVDASARKAITRDRHPIVIALLALVFGVLRYGIDDVRVNGWAIYNLALIYLFDGVSAAFHELGHALVARLVGFRVRLVRVGYGPVIWERAVRGCVFRLRAYPSGGLTYCGFEPELAQRWRLGAYMLGGLLAHATLLAVSCLVLSRARLIGVFNGSGAFFSRPSGIEVFVWMQAWLLVANAIPLPGQMRIGQKRLWRDGAEAVRALFASDAALRERAANARNQDVTDAIYEGDASRALHELDRMLVLQPDRAGARFLRGTLLLDLSRFAEALPEIERELAADRSRKAPVEEPWRMLTFYAAAVYGAGERSRLEEADRALAAGRALAPDDEVTRWAIELRAKLTTAPLDSP